MREITVPLEDGKIIRVIIEQDTIPAHHQETSVTVCMQNGNKRIPLCNLHYTAGCHGETCEATTTAFAYREDRCVRKAFNPCRHYHIGVYECVKTNGAYRVETRDIDSGIIVEAFCDEGIYSRDMAIRMAKSIMARNQHILWCCDAQLRGR